MTDNIEKPVEPAKTERKYAYDIQFEVWDYVPLYAQSGRFYRDAEKSIEEVTKDFFELLETTAKNEGREFDAKDVKVKSVVRVPEGDNDTLLDIVPEATAETSNSIN